MSNSDLYISNNYRTDDNHQYTHTQALTGGEVTVDVIIACEHIPVISI